MPLFFTLLFTATAVFFVREIGTSDTRGGVELACFLSLASLFLALTCGVWAVETWS